MGVSPFLVPRCPLVACQDAQTGNIYASGASFRVKMGSWSNDVFVELMGEKDAKNASTVRGELSFHRLPAKEEQRREWIVKIRRKKYPIYAPNTHVYGVHFDGGKRQDTYSVPARFVWTKPAKKRLLSQVIQATRFFDEVDMEVDEKISRKAGRP